VQETDMTVPTTPAPAPTARPGLLVYGLLMMVACCLPALLLTSLF
tara:strand:- start:2625 stop:2759 length:135 start_codon:yes stop_codon:yes gene_type:complete